MSTIIRSAALVGCTLAALGSALSAPAVAASVVPHVFEGGITLVDLAAENLEPWGFYDGTKGLPTSGAASGIAIETPVASGDPLPSGWIAAAGWGGPSDVMPAADPAYSPVPVPAGFGEPRRASPCFWGDGRFGSPASRNRCGHPVPLSSAGVPQGKPWPFTQPSFIVSTPGGAGKAKPEPPSPVPVPLPASGWLLAAVVAACGLRRRT